MYEYVGADHWERTTVFDLARWKNGLAFQKIDFSETGRPVIKIAELKSGITNQTKFTDGDYDKSVFVKSGDMLFSWSGNPDTSIDVSRWEGPEGWLNQHIYKVTPHKGVDEDFLFFLLRWLRPRFAEIARNKQTTGLGHVTLKDFKKMAVGLPNESEQMAIVSSVGPVQDKIDLNRRMNGALEAMARAIFKDWFVDFGPTRAKAEGRAPYLSSELWDLFPDALDDGDTPEGWSVDTLERLAATNSESWTARHHPPTVEYVDLSSTKWGNIEATTLLDWEAAPSRARRIAKVGDTIVGTTRPGNGSFAYVSRDGLTVSTGFAVLSPRSTMYRDTVYIAVTSLENIERLANLADGHGGAYPAVKPNEVTDTVIVFPGDEVLASFADLVSPIRERIEHAKAESRTLAQTRDLLLPRLMSGEIRIREAEKVVEAVA
ncbi:MAG: restriction endonuclease subunit S [Gemmatimonadota bacterium]|nr:restriction endonuclease subunit S [Caldilineaceae bacterium]MDE2773999.1 restriction endonuclease subunit S [Gemmatimonadota bacterium]